MTKEVEIKSKFNALYIDPIALRKIQYWADAADGEVSGLGIVEEQEDGNMLVTEAFILEQECTAADTELDPEAISKLMTDIIKDGKDPGKLKFWWHSHVNMGVFWSGTDDDCAETLSTEYAFSLVVNKHKDRRVRLDLYKPFRITVDHVRLVEMAEEDEDLKKRCEEDVKEKVKKKSWSYNKDKSFDRCRSRDWRGHGIGYYDGDYGYGYGYDHPYDDFDEPDKKRPKNWGKRVRLSEADIEDIKRLQELIHQWAYTEDALEDYVKETMQLMMKSIYDEKANCQGGPGEYWEDSDVCQKCDIASICKTLTEKYGDDLYEGENIVEVEDIEINDKERETVEVIVDHDERGGDNNGR